MCTMNEIQVTESAFATPDPTHNGVTTPAAHVQAALMAAFAFGYGKVVSTADHLAT